MPYDLANLKLKRYDPVWRQPASVWGRRSLNGRGGPERCGSFVSDLMDQSSGTKACVLVRFYVTTQYACLGPQLRAFGAKLMEGQQLAPTTRCLTLLATIGDRPEWNCRRSSRGHQTIPASQRSGCCHDSDGIPANHTVRLERRQPGCARRVAGAGGPPTDLWRLLCSRGERKPIHSRAGRICDPLPGVRSVLGFGGLLPSGDAYAALLFAKVTIPRAAADMFRNAAMNLKLALLPSLDQPIFREP